jgi:tetratricopeptide (TPR) repeat protein
MRAWKRVEVLAKQLLDDSAVIENSEDIQLYYFVAMLKLGRPPFVELQRDLSLFIHSSSGNDVKVVIALRLLQAELYQYGDGKSPSKMNSIDELSQLRKDLADFIDPSDPRYILWWRRITMSIVNVAVRTSNWRIALANLDDLRQRNNFTSPFQKLGYEIELLSRIGKIFLQMGNLDEGAAYMGFAEIADRERMSLGKEKGMSDIEVSPRVRLNSGLLAFAQNKFFAAAECFQGVIEFERQRQGNKKFTLEHDSLSQHSASSDDLLSTVFCGLDIEENIMIEAVNNYSICAMYMCDLQLAVSTLESLICEDPAANMSEVVVFNLCTMYELTCDNEVTNRRKRVLQKVAARFCLHDISSLAFRMS